MEDENAPGSVICVNAVRNEASDAAGSFASVALRLNSFRLPVPQLFSDRLILQH